MAVLQAIIENEAPTTIDFICEKTGISKGEVEREIEILLNENKLRHRLFLDSNGISHAVYWPATVIPFSQHTPIITSPFSDPFKPQEIMGRLSDTQLLQEKGLLQSRFRKLDTDYRELLHRSQMKMNPDEENKIKELTSKWLAATQEMMWDLLKEAKKRDSSVTMDRLIKEYAIDPALVHWDADEQDFV